MIDDWFPQDFSSTAPCAICFWSPVSTLLTWRHSSEVWGYRLAGAHFGCFILLFPGAADYSREHVYLFGQDHQASDPWHHGGSHTARQGQAKGLRPARGSLWSKAAVDLTMCLWLLECASQCHWSHEKAYLNIRLAPKIQHWGCCNSQLYQTRSFWCEHKSEKNLWVLLQPHSF